MGITSRRLRDCTIDMVIDALSPFGGCNGLSNVILMHFAGPVVRVAPNTVSVF